MVPETKTASPAMARASDTTSSPASPSPGPGPPPAARRRQARSADAATEYRANPPKHPDASNDVVVGRLRRSKRPPSSSSSFFFFGSSSPTETTTCRNRRRRRPPRPPPPPPPRRRCRLLPDDHSQIAERCTVVQDVQERLRTVKDAVHDHEEPLPLDVRIDVPTARDAGGQLYRSGIREDPVQCVGRSPAIGAYEACHISIRPFPPPSRRNNLFVLCCSAK